MLRGVELSTLVGKELLEIFQNDSYETKNDKAITIKTYDNEKNCCEEHILKSDKEKIRIAFRKCQNITKVGYSRPIPNYTVLQVASVKEKDMASGEYNAFLSIRIADGDYMIHGDGKYKLYKVE